jgi:hypothetical protein
MEVAFINDVAVEIIGYCTMTTLGKYVIIFS